MGAIRVNRRLLLAAGAGGLAASTFPALVRAQPKRKLRIALSNSYIGNKWRIEMENLFKAALQMEPYK
jgi:ribose transport system substrate-binding protein